MLASNEAFWTALAVLVLRELIEFIYDHRRTIH